MYSSSSVSQGGDQFLGGLRLSFAVSLPSPLISRSLKSASVAAAPEGFSGDGRLRAEELHASKRL